MILLPQSSAKAFWAWLIWPAGIFSKDITRVTQFTRMLDCDIQVINGGTLRGDGGDLGEGYFSHTVATPTGEGICTPRDFVRKRRIMTHAAFRFV